MVQMAFSLTVKMIWWMFRSLNSTHSTERPYRPKCNKIIKNLILIHWSRTHTSISFDIPQSLFQSFFLNFFLLQTKSLVCDSVFPIWGCNYICLFRSRKNVFFFIIYSIQPAHLKPFAPIRKISYHYNESTTPNSLHPDQK